MAQVSDVLSAGLAQIEERFVRLEVNIAANAALLLAVVKRSEDRKEILADAEVLLGAECSDAPEPFLELVRARMHRLLDPQPPAGRQSASAIRLMKS